MLRHLPRAVLQRPYVVPRATAIPLSRSFATTRIASKNVTKEDVEKAALATAEQEQLEGLPVDLPTPGATSSAPSAGTSAAGGNAAKAASSGRLSDADVRKAAMDEAEAQTLDGANLAPGAAYKASTRPLNEGEKSGVWWLLGGVAAVVAGGYWLDKRYDANKLAKQAKDKAVDLKGQAVDKAHDLQDEATVKARELKGQAEAAKTGAIDKANELKGKAVAAKDQAVDKTIAAKDQAVDSAVAAKDKAVQKSLDAKNEVVDKVNDAKKAVSGK